MSIKNIDLNYGNHYASSPLSYAVNYNHIDVVKTLLVAGADVNGSKYHSSKPTINAACDGNYKIVDILLGWGADPNAKVGARTVLHFLKENRQSIERDEIITRVKHLQSRRPKDGIFSFFKNHKHGKKNTELQHNENSKHITIRNARLQKFYKKHGKKALIHWVSGLYNNELENSQFRFISSDIPDIIDFFLEKGIDINTIEDGETALTTLLKHSRNEEI